MTSKSGKTAGKLILKEDKCIYISVIDTLKQLIKIDSVRNVVNNFLMSAETSITVHVHVEHIIIAYMLGPIHVHQAFCN